MGAKQFPKDWSMGPLNCGLSYSALIPSLDFSFDVGWCRKYVRFRIFNPFLRQEIKEVLDRISVLIEETIWFKNWWGKTRQGLSHDNLRFFFAWSAGLCVGIQLVTDSLGHCVGWQIGLTRGWWFECDAIHSLLAHMSLLGLRGEALSLPEK